MADNKTCGNCARWHELISIPTVFGYEPVGVCAFRSTSDNPPNFIGIRQDNPVDDCMLWKQKQLTKEERCQQLGQLAREMYRYMDGVMNNNWAFSLPSDTDTFRHMLEELGVSMDG